MEHLHSSSLQCSTWDVSFMFFIYIIGEKYYIRTQQHLYVPTVTCLYKHQVYTCCHCL
uniref:Uncharacterized protein n=1 Tax=Arundo donax TaxID=35708 RepID=A0A0A9BUR0_ARUDO